jgi:hypothetical protein
MRRRCPWIALALVLLSGSPGCAPPTAAPPADGGPDGMDGGGCVPWTCADLGARCGQVADGCGQTIPCGVCQPGWTCAGNQCTCTPACGLRVCGDDGCGGSCGACGQEEFCAIDGRCQPRPDECPDTKDCDGRVCGPDPVCGLSCGDCGPHHECAPDWTCRCVRDCAGKQCGDDGCGGSCATCPGGYTCGDGQQCTCAPDCADKQCGPDGCGGSCGLCDLDLVCGASGLCEACIPDCTGRQCGPDGCGGSCGACGEGFSCDGAGQCFQLGQDMDRFLSLERIHQIEILVDEGGVQSLRDQPKEYVLARVFIDGQEFPQVGVRLKGRWGSFRPIDDPKPAFVIDFNRFVPGTDLLGLKKLVLNNLVQDPACAREYLAYVLFRQAGVPAPRAGYSQVTFNGMSKGLHLLLEALDTRMFLERWFGSYQGNLYKMGEYFTDLWAGQIPGFDQEHGDDQSRDDLANLIAALDSVPPGGDTLPVLEQRFIWDDYLRYAALEAYLGDWDGYPYNINNYYLYHDPDDDRWTFVPWDTDQTFADRLSSYEGVMSDRGPSWAGRGGRIQNMCFASPACLQGLASAYLEVLPVVASVDLPGLLLQIRGLVEAPAVAELGEGVSLAMDATRDFILARADQIQVWVPCLAGGSVDLDGDGSNDCVDDCDPWSPEVHPGAVEVCNGLDDNCDGRVDDADPCPDCTELVDGGARFSFCAQARSWGEALVHCGDLGGTLAVPVDEAQQLFLASTVATLGVHDEWWIGVNDQAGEGGWVDAEGTPVSYLPWAAGMPNGDTVQNCVVIETSLGGGWNDRECDEARPSICRLP